MCKLNSLGGVSLQVCSCSVYKYSGDLHSSVWPLPFHVWHSAAGSFILPSVSSGIYVLVESACELLWTLENSFC